MKRLAGTRRFIFAGLWGLLLWPALAGGQEWIEGAVRFADDGALAAGVRVVLFARHEVSQFSEGHTDADGRFRIEVSRLTGGGSTRPSSFELLANYPNPFNPGTTIPYRLNTAGQVSLEVYNLLGQRIRVLVDRPQPPGGYAVSWDARDGAGRGVAAGVYIYRLTVDGQSVSRKMLLVDGGAPAVGRGAEATMAPGAGGIAAAGGSGEFAVTVSGAGVQTYVDPEVRGEWSLVVERAAPGKRPKPAQETSRILGDVNRDGRVDIVDALIVATYGIDPTITIPNQGDITLGDVNGDGIIDIVDALMIATYGVDPTNPSLPPGIGQPVADRGTPGIQVVIEPPDGGSVSIDPAAGANGTWDLGQKVSFTATPSPDYYFVGYTMEFPWVDDDPLDIGDIGVNEYALEELQKLSEVITEEQLQELGNKINQYIMDHLNNNLDFPGKIADKTLPPADYNKYRLLEAMIETPSGIWTEQEMQAMVQDMKDYAEAFYAGKGVEIDPAEPAEVGVELRDNIKLTARFEQEAATPDYTTIVIVQKGNGTVTPTPGLHTYTSSDHVQIGAIPANGWVLESITVDRIDNLPELEFFLMGSALGIPMTLPPGTLERATETTVGFNLHANHHFYIVVTFVELPTYEGSGQVKTLDGAPIPEVTIKTEGEEIDPQETTTDSDGRWNITGLRGEVTVTPEKEGYVFKPENSTITEDDSSLSFEGTSDHARTFTLIVGKRGNGTVTSGSGDNLIGTYEIGFWDPWTLWATPAEGWVFVGWEISTSNNPTDNDSWQPAEEETFHVWKGWPDTHTRVIAVFVEDDPPSNGMVTVYLSTMREDYQPVDGQITFDPYDPDGQVPTGTTITIDTNPNLPGYEFVRMEIYMQDADGNWFEYGTFNTPSVEVATTGDVSVTAIFRRK